MIDEVRQDGASISAYSFDRSSSDFIAAAAEGKIPDSETDEPVRIEPFETDDLVGSVLHYADHSVALLTLEKPSMSDENADPTASMLGTSVGLLGGGLAMGRAPGAIPGGHAPMATVTGCQALPNSGGWVRRKNCKVTYSTALLGWRFYANYSVRSGGGRIDSLRADPSYYYNRLPSRQYVGEGVQIYRKLATGSATPADGRGWLKTHQVGITQTRWLSIRVYGSAWAVFLS